MGAEGKPFSFLATRNQKQQQMQDRVRAAVAELVSEGRVPSFYQVSQRAGVARSTLYRNDDLRALVERARAEALQQEESRPCGQMACSPPWREGGATSAQRAAFRQIAAQAPCYVYAVCLLNESP